MYVQNTFVINIVRRLFTDFNDTLTTKNVQVINYSGYKTHITTCKQTVDTVLILINAEEIKNRVQYDNISIIEWLNGKL